VSLEWNDGIGQDKIRTEQKRDRDSDGEREWERTELNEKWMNAKKL
jgi:hypothetical protein